MRQKDSFSKFKFVLFQSLSFLISMLVVTSVYRIFMKILFFKSEVSWFDLPKILFFGAIRDISWIFLLIIVPLSLSCFLFLATDSREERKISKFLWSTCFKIKHMIIYFIAPITITIHILSMNYYSFFQSYFTKNKIDDALEHNIHILITFIKNINLSQTYTVFLSLSLLLVYFLLIKVSFKLSKNLSSKLNYHKFKIPLLIFGIVFAYSSKVTSWDI